MGDPLLRQGGVLAFSMLLLHVANWLYHVVLSRALGPIEYGAVSAVLALLLLFTVPATAIQMGMSAIVARRRTALGGGGLWLGRRLKGAAALGVAGSAALIILSPWVSGLLGLASPGAIVVGAGVLIPWSVLPFLRGWLQGQQRAMALGASLTTEGVLKLAIAVLLVGNGLGAVGAVGGVGLGALGALLLTLPLLRGAGPGAGEAQRADGPAGVLLPYLFVVGAFSVLTQADVVLVKALFPAHQAGLYAAASTAAKIVLYVTAPLSMVMLPETVRRHTGSGEGEAVLRRAAQYAGLVGGTVAALYLVVPATVIRILFGPAYLDAAPLLGWLGLGMLAYELALLGAYYLLGVGDREGLWWIAAPAVIFPALVVAAGQSLPAVVTVVVGLGISVCAAVWWRLWPRLRGSGSRPVLQGARDAAD